MLKKKAKLSLKVFHPQGAGMAPGGSAATDDELAAGRGRGRESSWPPSPELEPDGVAAPPPAPKTWLLGRCRGRTDVPSTGWAGGTADPPLRDAHIIHNPFEINKTW